MAEKIQLLRNELAATEQRMSEINSRRAYTIRAPAAGRVSMLQATVGQTADPRRLQLEILPSNSVLQAELFIPTRAAGFVQVGQEVRLLYEAFPYQKFGTYKGRIIKLSQTILTATDVYGPVALKEPAYKATVALARPDIDADGKKITLQSDMLLTADIVLERRSILGWLLNPLFSAKKVIDFDTLKESIQNSVIDPLRRAVKEIIQDIIPKVQTSNRNKSYDSNRSKSS
jgi:membrane fusion protein